MRIAFRNRPRTELSFQLVAMLACVQRVTSAHVEVEQEVIGRIGPGMVVLLGIHVDDGPEDVAWMAKKLVALRIFEDDAGKMNRSLADTGGAMLLVSQFTLLGDCRKGRRPSFVAAAGPEQAEPLYQQLVDAVRRQHVAVETGRFRATMQVHLVNDGPVTVLVEKGSGVGVGVSNSYLTPDP